MSEARRFGFSCNRSAGFCFERVAAGSEQSHLAQAGAPEPGSPDYWHLHGPLSGIKSDNPRNEPIHIHSVWHDLVRNFGRDLLREHCEIGRHAHA